MWSERRALRDLEREVSTPRRVQVQGLGRMGAGVGGQAYTMPGIRTAKKRTPMATVTRGRGSSAVLLASWGWVVVGVVVVVVVVGGGGGGGGDYYYYYYYYY